MCHVACDTAFDTLTDRKRSTWVQSRSFSVYDNFSLIAFGQFNSIIEIIDIERNVSHIA